MKLYQALRGEDETRSNLTDWINWIQQHASQGWPFSGTSQTLGAKQEEIPATFQGFAEQIFKANPIVFGCEMARLSLFCEAHFQFRRRVLGRPGELFGTKALAPLEEPWPEASTADLLERMLLDADLGGNFFGVRRAGGRIMRMRPDWVTIVLGSRRKPSSDIGYGDLEVEPIGYLYQPGGKTSGQEPIALRAEEVAHFAPIVDPLNSFRGMSWLTPVIREAMGDKAGTDHKLNYLEGGATPNAVVKVPETMNPEAFEKFRELFKEGRAQDPYGPLFLGGGADYTVVGSDMKKIDFKAIQAQGENRICVASRVPSIIAGVAAGLEASTYSNVAQAKRFFADASISPLWAKACAALAPLIEVPGGAELFYDSRDIPYLQEDRSDEAEIQQKQAVTITQLVKEGFTPESAVLAVTSNDMGRLVHTGLVSVQLQEPGAEEPSSNGSGSPAAVPTP